MSPKFGNNWGEQSALQVIVYRLSLLIHHLFNNHSLLWRYWQKPALQSIYNNLQPSQYSPIRWLSLQSVCIRKCLQANKLCVLLQIKKNAVVLVAQGWQLQVHYTNSWIYSLEISFLQSFYSGDWVWGRKKNKEFLHTIFLLSDLFQKSA